MKKWNRLWLAAAVAALAMPIQILPARVGDDRASPPAVRYHGVLIRVPDLERAGDFYGDIIGFRKERLTDRIMRLAGETPIYLEEVRFPLRPPADNEARSSIAFQTADIATAIVRLRARGVEFLSPEPFEVGVGLAIRFRDPFGNIHSLLQQTVGPTATFAEPQVYNSGFKHPDSRTAALRALFVDTLGFVVRTERYFPPSLPIGHADGSFAFMLHENEPREPEVVDREDPEAAAVSLVFSSGDLARLTAVPTLRSAGLRVGPTEAFVLGRRARIVLPSGVPAELWSQTEPPDAD